jgi:glycosyltransferase involved in cell wall biosynthesis
MKLVSICIPTYEMHGLGEKFLQHSFDVLVNQTFKDFEVVISDHSKTNAIKDLCEIYKDKLDIAYYANTEHRGNSSANINNSIKKARGKLIKFLMQDDFLYTENSLKEIVRHFDMTKDNWLVTACEHTTDGINFYKPFYPTYHDKIHIGRNTISSPSVLTIKNDGPLLFDEKLLQRTDGDYYKRCYDRFGEPKILNSICVVNRAGLHQVSNTMITESLKDFEYQYVLKKYHKKFPRILIFVRNLRKNINHLRRIVRKII